jgi:hypothetical protein
VILLALLMTAGASTEAWVRTSGMTGPACGDAALVHTVHQWRPQLSLHEGTSADANALQVVLERGAGVYTLRLHGPELSMIRIFQDRGDCEVALRTAALIVDGALDQLGAPRTAPPIDLAPPLRLEVAAVIDASVLRGVLGTAGAGGVSLLFRLGLAEWAVDGELEPGVSAPGSGSLPSGTSAQWTWRASVGGGVEATGGVAPRVGPGTLSVDGGVGFSDATVSVTHITGVQLFQQRSATAVAPFLALRVSYSLDLPSGFFVTARVEGRWVPDPVVVQVQGTEATGAAVGLQGLVPVGTLGVGWRFR